MEEEERVFVCCSQGVMVLGFWSRKTHDRLQTVIDRFGDNGKQGRAGHRAHNTTYKIKGMSVLK